MGDLPEEKVPFDELFDKIGDVLQLIQTNVGRSIEEEKLTPEVSDMLEKLERDVLTFKKISDDIVALSEVPKEELKKRLAGISDDLPPQGKRLIDKGQALKKHIEKMRDAIPEVEIVAPEDSVSAAQGNGKVEIERSSKKSAQRRRRKFKRFGGDADWKPL